ncbi:hypothetical protein B0T25DRAFT_548856 [Lasiosphaeria hispida]|uniref:Uncharacterized protein n=1 Tax=Lasiosphaeria hispida TaxID=260671 RepID=A0AAJ0MCL4_9PEZI|nr:hypothetical protein B0T25DRAFT_548856 [Lasiosphaeria hispida]
MPRWKIRGWIERTPHHIQEVIRCEGGNEYKEGRPSSLKSRKVNCLEESIEDNETLDSEVDSVDSASWHLPDVYSKDEEVQMGGYLSTGSRNWDYL